jgi:hypothetical protein
MKMKVLVCFAMTLSLLFSGARSAAFFAGDEVKAEKIGAESLIRTSALKINVDMKQALSFYSDKLGFVIEDRTDYPKQVILKTNERIKSSWEVLALLNFQISSLISDYPTSDRISVLSIAQSKLPTVVLAAQRLDHSGLVLHRLMQGCRVILVCVRTIPPAEITLFQPRRVFP